MRHYLRAVLVFGIVALSNSAKVQAGYDAYLALGDSVTFGVGADNSPADISNGDRGYVGIVADRLGMASGVRPQVVNLAISGETSFSFFGNPAGPANIVSPDAVDRNTNYGAPGFPQVQNDAFLATVGSILAGGNTISNLSISLGPNDLFALRADPIFQMADPATQYDMYLATLNGIGTNLFTLLGEIATFLPSTQVAILGTYDPFNGADPQVATAIAGLNSALQQTTLQAGAFFGSANFRFVDISILGSDPLNNTYIGIGDVHPTARGYTLIANQIIPVPEPSSVILLGIGTSAAFALARCRSLASMPLA